MILFNLNWKKGKFMRISLKKCVISYEYIW